MNNPSNIKVSQFLDDDLSQSESLKLLMEMQQQPDLQQTLQRYRLINQALKAQPILTADHDFVSKISEQIASEPTYLLSKTRPKEYRFKTASLALAASITIAAVIVPIMQKINTGHNASLVAQTVNETELLAKLNLIPENSEQPPHLYPVNQRFQGYLQAHNGSLYTNGADEFQSRTQLASYVQAK